MRRGMTVVLVLAMALSLPACRSVVPTATNAPTPTVMPTTNPTDVQPTPGNTQVPTVSPTPIPTIWRTKTVEYESWWGDLLSVQLRYRFVDGHFELDPHPAVPMDTTYYNLTPTYDPDLFLLDTSEEILTLDTRTWTVSDDIMAREGYTMTQIRDAFTSWRAKQDDLSYIPCLGAEIHMNAEGTGLVFYSNWRFLFEDSAVNGELRFHDLRTGRDVSLGPAGIRIGWAENGKFYTMDWEYNVVAIDVSSATRSPLVSLGGNYSCTLIADELLVPYRNSLDWYSLVTGKKSTVDTRYDTYTPFLWVASPDPHRMLIGVRSDATDAHGDLALYWTGQPGLKIFEMPADSWTDGEGTYWADSDHLHVVYKITGSSDLYALDVSVSDFK
jgi:hypothetical protein